VDRLTQRRPDLARRSWRGARHGSPRNRTTTALYDSETFRKNIETAYEAMLA